MKNIILKENYCTVVKWASTFVISKSSIYDFITCRIPHLNTIFGRFLEFLTKFFQKGRQR
jgi:hypothetical protein